MARLRDLQKQVHGDTCIKSIASVTMLLSVLDSFRLEKIENNDIKLKAFIHVFSTEISAKNLIELAQPLGDWLIKLPKEIWDNKDIKI